MKLNDRLLWMMITESSHEHPPLYATQHLRVLSNAREFAFGSSVVALNVTLRQGVISGNRDLTRRVAA